MRYLALLALLALTGCRETILHQLSETQANQVQLLLSQRGIEAAKVPDGAGWSLSVGGKQVIAALSEIRRARITQTHSDATDKSSSKGILQSPEERAYGFERELAAELENTLERMPHVLEARVHLHMEQNEFSPGAQASKPMSAAVLLVTEDAVEQTAVQQLLAGASGVAPEQVSVIVSLNPTPVPPTVPKEKPVITAKLGRFTIPIVGSLCFIGALLLLSKRRARKPKLQTEVSLKEFTPQRESLRPSELNGHAAKQEANGVYAI